MLFSFFPALFSITTSLTAISVCDLLPLPLQLLLEISVVTLLDCCSQCSLPPSILSDITSVVSLFHYHLVYQRHFHVISNCCQWLSVSISLLIQVVMVITSTSLFNVMVYIFRLLRSLPVHSSSSRISALSLK